MKIPLLSEFMWPQVPLHLFGMDFTWSLLGYNVLYDAAAYVAPAVYNNILVTVITGGVSMIIFPEGQASKQACANEKA